MGCILNKNQVHVVGDPSAKTGSESQDRGGSATSKASKHSGDSGFDDDEAQLISEQMLIQRDILSRPAFGGRKDIERQEEKRILATLHEEGLIQRPIVRKAFGVSFEVMAGDSEIPGVLKKPPPRLAKLERRRKKKRVLTEEQIKEKLRKAEERRKEQEQLRLAKIQSLHKTDLHNATETFVQTQRDLEEVEETSKTKEEVAAENRERKLKEKLERLRLRKEHAAEVRRRKAEAARAAAAAGNTMTTEEESLKQMSSHTREEAQKEGFRAAVSSSANTGGWGEAE